MSWSPDIDRHPHAWSWRGNHFVLTSKQLNPPDVRVRAVRAKFLVDGRLVEVGEIVTLPAHEATRLEAAGHVERIDGGP